MYLFINLYLKDFEFCRTVVVDAAHLSGAYKEMFVSANILDGASN